jgi:DnaJ like chaperone protein
MNWWGKIIVGGLGWLAGGPIGLALGVFFGHVLDRGVEQIQSVNPFRPWRAGEREQVQSVFFDTTFALMGHLAKADGHVSEDEIAHARVAMARMQLSDAQKERAIDCFRQGKADDFPVDQVVADFARAVRRRKHLILPFLETLLESALADGEISADEQQLLVRIAAGLGIPEAQFRQILNMVMARHQFAGAGQQGGFEGASAHTRDGFRQPPLSRAYQVLGLDENASNSEIKKAYRRLMSKHHPDKLMARGLPEEMIKRASEKTAEIRRAFEMLKEARGI